MQVGLLRHKFCFDCIFNWGTKEENLCPLCKQKFNSILKKDENGDSQKIEILDKKIGQIN